MIFPKLKTDKILQVDDLTRLDGTLSSFRDIDDIVSVEIKPEATADFVELDSERPKDWFLDYAYETAGEKVVTLKITDSDGDKERESTITVLSVEDDNLFSNDNDILSNEPDLYRYLPHGRSSFNFAHREAQTRIIAYLDEKRIWKSDNTRYEKSDIVDLEEFRHWSRFLTLNIIFNSLVVNVDDVFSEKANHYKGLMELARARATIRLEYEDDDIENSVTRESDNVTTIMVRR